MKTVRCNKCGKEIEIISEETSLTDNKEIAYFKQLFEENFICQGCKNE